MKKVLSIVLALALVLSLAACGAGASDDAQSTESADEGSVKIGIVYTVGGLGDLAFNDAVYEGAIRAEKELGVVVTHTEPKSASEIEMSLEELSSSGEYDLIISLCYESVDALSRVAAEYPEQMYMHVDDEMNMDNVRSYIGRENESAFLSDVLAGLMQAEENRPNELITDSNTIGIIGAVDANVVNRHIAGYICGAKYVNPSIEVIYDYVGAFDDVAAGQSMAESMYAKGINICYNAASACGLGMFKAAQDKGFIGIGLDSNQNHVAPDNIAFSSMKYVDNWTFDAIKAIVDGTFSNGTYYMGLADDGVGISFEGSNLVINDDVKAIVEEIKAKVVNGELTVPSTLDEVESWVAANSYNG